VTGNEQPEGGPALDVPAGWIDDKLYYLRSFADQPGVYELHQTDWNGANDTVVTTIKDITLTADHPISTGSVILIPTESTWLAVDASGNVSDLGGNTTGAVGDAQVSPFGSLILYVSGGQLNLARTDSPGSVIASVTLPDAGFAFSPDGEQFVTAGTDGLVIFSTADGSQLNFIPNGPDMHASNPAWTPSGVLFFDIGAQNAMRRYVIE
jgi:WD40 repeat protein